MHQACTTGGMIGFEDSCEIEPPHYKDRGRKGARPFPRQNGGTFQVFAEAKGFRSVSLRIDGRRIRCPV